MKAWANSGTTGVIIGTYLETVEAVFQCKLMLKDVAGNSTDKVFGVVYPDYSGPGIIGLDIAKTNRIKQFQL